MNSFLYLTTILVWGSTWVSINLQLGVVPIAVSVFYRFAIAAFLLFIWCFYKKSNLRFSFKTHLMLLAQGFFMFSINYISCYEAAKYISSGLNAIGFSMVLMFNIINSAIFYRTPLTLPIVAGAISGLVGIVCIFWPAIATLDLTNASLYGIILSLIGGVMASFGNMISARNQQNGIPVTESNAYAMGYGTLLILSVILLTNIDFAFDWSVGYVFSLFHLAIFGSVVAFGCYLTLLGRIGASKAAYTLIVVPVIALGVSTIFEKFTWEFHVFLGVGLILFGNIIILTKRPASIAHSIKEKIRRKAIIAQSGEEGA